MRPFSGMARTPILVLCLLALAAAACGGGGGAEPARAIPTLTDPASVPVADPNTDRTPFTIGKDTVTDPGGGSIDRAPLPGVARRYTVVEGDTCGAIASAFGIGVEELLNENPLIDGGCTNLAIGWELRIPAGAVATDGGGNGSTVGGTVYTVVGGDTCSDIATAHDVPLSTFLAVNGLTDEDCTLLSIGQEVTIPR